MSCRGPAGARLGIQSPHAHLSHQPLYPLAVHALAFILQPIPQSSATVERALQMHLIEPAHQG